MWFDLFRDIKSLPVRFRKFKDHEFVDDTEYELVLSFIVFWFC